MKQTVLAILVVSAMSATTSQGGSIEYNAGARNESGSPITFMFTHGKPFVDGPIGIVKQSIGMTGIDATGDGFSATNMAVETLIDGSVVHTMNLGDCTAGAGSAGGAFGCAPTGDQWTPASGAISKSGTGPFGVEFKATLSPGDLLAIVVFGQIEGQVIGTNANSIAPSILEFSTFTNPQDHDVNYTLIYGISLQNAEYTNARLNLAAALLDPQGDGASANLSAKLLFGGDDLGISLQDACTISNGVLAGAICRGGASYGPSSAAVNGPAAGLFGQRLKFTLSGNGDALAAIGGAEWGPSSEIPEPASWSMLLAGGAVIFLRRRRR